MGSLKANTIKICNYCRRVLGKGNFRQGRSECKRCERNNTLLHYNKVKRKLYCEKNKEHIKKYTIKYHEKHKESLNKQSLQYYYNNKVKINNQSRLFRINNKEFFRLYSKQWRENNRGKISVYGAKRRTLEKNATPDDANLSIIQFYYTVASTMANYEVDHYQPLSKGGLHHQDNLQILKADLNREKSAKWPLTEEEKIKYKGYRL